MISDGAARETVRTALDATLFVEAGAGTGKTTALVGRIVELVTSGVAMRRIAAITFTEAAAAELRDRVRLQLEAAARAGTVSPQAVAEVDEAAVSTLHSFAQRLISDHPLEAGLPPTIEVLDEIESSLEFDERWRRFVDELFADPAYERVLLRGFATGLRVDALRDAALVFHDQRDRLATGPGAEPPPLAPVDARPLVSALRTAAALGQHCTDPSDKLLGWLGRFTTWADQLEAADDELELLHRVESLRRLRFTNGKGPSWSCPVQDVRDATADAADARNSLLESVRQEVLGHLLEAVRRFTVRSAEERRAQGRLVFHDLLVAARDLVRNAPDVRAALHDRFTHLLIDEFQDTDPLQVELAVLLATDDPDVGQRPWEQVTLEAGRLFFVGDAQQSIYRFRRADIDLFLRVRAAKADEVLALTTNFRSVPGIVAWVNAVFGHLFADGDAGGQPSFHPLSPNRPPVAGGAAVLRLGGDPVDAAISEIRALEANEIATMVRQAVADRWMVGDDTVDGGRRAARYGDIAVLIPTRTSLAQLEPALEDADVPYRVESSSLVWSTQQVRELLSVLRSIDDPADEVELVAALRSPPFACSDDDLLAYQVAGGAWDYTSPAPEALADTQPVVAARRVLRQLHDDRWWTGLAGMVDRVARQLKFFELAFAHRRPRDHWRRLRFVLDQARAFEEAPGATMRGFLDWAERQSSDDIRIREPVLPESDDDAVRILTIHGAKGLEFPIVVMSGLNLAQHRASTARVLWDDAGTYQAKVGPFRTPGFEQVHDIEARMDRQERLRLLYVAATRARDVLVVSTHRKSGTSDAQVLCDAVTASDSDGLWAPFQPAWTLSVPPEPTPALEPADLPEARRQWDADRHQLLEAHRRLPTRAATAIAAGGRPATDSDISAIEPDPGFRPHRKGRAGTSIGRAVHATLQSVALTGGLDGGERATELAAAAAAQAAAEGIDALGDEVTALVRAALDCELVGRAAAGRHWRELYVGAPVGPTLVEGFIDLLYEDEGGGLIIVDYKTDALDSGSELDAAVHRYRLQLATYALALEVSLGRPVSGAALLFLSQGAARTRWVADLPQAVAEVRRLLEATG